MLLLCGKKGLGSYGGTVIIGPASASRLKTAFKSPFRFKIKTNLQTPKKLFKHRQHSRKYILHIFPFIPLFNSDLKLAGYKNKVSYNTIHASGTAKTISITTAYGWLEVKFLFKTFLFIVACARALKASLFIFTVTKPNCQRRSLWGLSLSSSTGKKHLKDLLLILCDIIVEHFMFALRNYCQWYFFHFSWKLVTAREWGKKNISCGFWRNNYSSGVKPTKHFSFHVEFKRKFLDEGEKISFPGWRRRRRKPFAAENIFSLPRHWNKNISKLSSISFLPLTWYSPVFMEGNGMSTWYVECCCCCWFVAVCVSKKKYNLSSRTLLSPFVAMSECYLIFLSFSLRRDKRADVKWAIPVSKWNKRCPWGGGQ